jgi:uncharacterized protein with HEPN domain
MWEAAESILEFTQGLDEEAFGADKKTQHAVVWDLAVLGEAARHVPDAVTQRYPDVPWSKIPGMRNHITHGYDRIDADIVWRVVAVELRPLIDRLKVIHQEVEGSSSDG